MRLKVIHLVDDNKLGGVSLALQGLLGSELQQDFDFEICQINLSNFKQRRYSADIICLHAATSWRKLPALVLLRLANLGTPILYQEHHYCQGFVTHQVKTHRRFYLMLKLSYCLMNRVLAVSQAQRQWMLNKRLAKADKVYYVGQAKPLELFSALPTPTLTEPVVIGAYGRFHQQKGFDLLLEAVGQISCENIELRLAGAGELGKELIETANAQPNRDKIAFVGEINDIAGFLKQCHIVVIPSRWEPFGLTCQESLAAGKVVIASNVDGLTEQIDEIATERSGGAVLLDELSVTCLVKALRLQLELAQVHKSSSQGYGLKRCERAKVELAWPRMLQNWRKLLYSVVD
ncbi:glycosyltransferase family 4 protein [Shewanella sp. UCD-KL12]|uniref:glycosyltransferase family 4 protein n=1 Tax=Shewanella sp. UCD-KL12 TaxID=1917163 RepID=UPI000970591C|nr:glycosyltransferase family 4 protein [Shewanella sp. UCD-KL12]